MRQKTRGAGDPRPKVNGRREKSLGVRNKERTGEGRGRGLSERNRADETRTTRKRGTAAGKAIRRNKRSTNRTERTKENN